MTVRNEEQEWNTKAIMYHEDTLLVARSSKQKVLARGVRSVGTEGEEHGDFSVSVTQSSMCRSMSEQRAIADLRRWWMM